ncbi:MAG: PEP-CTERM sorting domain-containing protein [Phycisphaerales bacterium]|jgi:hypothetical protein|nr:PEP-CTERM sorting domain-containing protein [Phycisphaerales bacterium]
MRITLTITAILMLASSPVLAELTITAPNILVSDDMTGGSFEVFVSTDETNTISSYMTRLTLDPGSSGISFDSVEPTTDHSYVFPSSTGNFFATISPDGTTIDVGDGWLGAAQSLSDGAGLFKVNYTISPSVPPYPIFDMIISDDPAETMLTDHGNNVLGYTVDNGEIQMGTNGPHKLQVTFRPQQGSEGNWATETSTLVVTYGELGATTGRADIGINGDTSVGWGDSKYLATEAGQFGVYSRGEPFGSGDDMLTQDARALTDTSNVLIETYTNQVFSKPGAWVVGETWNEGGVLEFEVLTDDKTFFDDFEIVQKEPGRFLNTSRTPDAIALGDLADWYEGQGSLAFGRVGCDWFADREVDWLTGPFASFDLIPAGGEPWLGTDAPLSVEPGTYAIAHDPTPEPSSIAIFAVAGFGFCSRRRKLRPSR